MTLPRDRSRADTPGRAEEEPRTTAGTTGRVRGSGGTGPGEAAGGERAPGATRPGERSRLGEAGRPGEGRLAGEGGPPGGDAPLGDGCTAGEFPRPGEARTADGGAHPGTDVDARGDVAHRGGGRTSDEDPRLGDNVPAAPGGVRPGVRAGADAGAGTDPGAGPAAVMTAAADRIIARGEAHVWWWRCPERVDPADLALLGTEEFRRALGMLAERDAAEFVRTRAGARRALGELLDISPATALLGHRRCPGCGADDHGPPLLVRPGLPLAISLSRTAGWGVFVVGAGLGIGVDAEALRPVRESLYAGSVLTAAERRHLDAMSPGPARHAAFHRVWTRKEAVVKAVGVGLVGTELDQLETHPDQDGPLRVTHHGIGRPTEWTVEDLRLSDHLAVALARAAGPAARGPVHLHPPTGL